MINKLTYFILTFLFSYIFKCLTTIVFASTPTPGSSGGIPSDYTNEIFGYGTVVFFLFLLFHQGYTSIYKNTFKENIEKTHSLQPDFGEAILDFTFWLNIVKATIDPVIFASVILYTDPTLTQFQTITIIINLTNITLKMFALTNLISKAGFVVNLDMSKEFEKHEKLREQLKQIIEQEENIENKNILLEILKQLI
jgi:hypothetical protein